MQALDFNRVKLKAITLNADSEQERMLAEELLQAYDRGLLELSTDKATGELMVGLKEAN